MEQDERPWGTYAVLSDAPGHKVKRIVVLRGRGLSYQRHARRSEHWFVLEGTGVVTLDGNEVLVPPGTAVDIPVNAAHRIANSTPRSRKTASASSRGGQEQHLLRHRRDDLALCVADHASQGSAATSVDEALHVLE
jgi:mannose-6-phosphate isomerase-like protein (cupin superfamily)